MDIKIRQGETLQIPVVSDDTSAASVQLQVAQNGTVYINEIETFTVNDDGKAEATIRTDDTSLPTGDYEYMLTVIYQDGSIDKLPDPDECDGDCRLPKFIVCEGEFGVS